MLQSIKSLKIQNSTCFLCFVWRCCTLASTFCGTCSVSAFEGDNKYSDPLSLLQTLCCVRLLSISQNTTSTGATKWHNSRVVWLDWKEIIFSVVCLFKCECNQSLCWNCRRGLCVVRPCGKERFLPPVSTLDFSSSGSAIWKCKVLGRIENASYPLTRQAFKVSGWEPHEFPL